MMGALIHVDKPMSSGLMLTNNTGVALVANEFTVICGKILKATAAIASTAVGAFENLFGEVFQIDSFASGEDAFATIHAAVYWDPVAKKFSDTLTVGYYRVGYVFTIKDANNIVEVLGVDPVLMPASVTDLAAEVAANKAPAGIKFRKTAVLTSALATTPVVVLAASLVTGTNKAFVEDFLLYVSGADAWVGTGTVVKLQDTNSSPVVGVSFAKAQLTNGALIGKLTAGATLGDAIKKGTGFTAAKGLSIVADGTFETSGSDIYITVCGSIAAA